jgi:hypothetical protein
MLSERPRSYSVSKVGSGRRSGKRRFPYHVVTIAGAGQSLILRIAPISHVLWIAGVHARRQSLALRYSKAAGQEQHCCRGVQTVHGLLRTRRLLGCTLGGVAGLAATIKLPVGKLNSLLPEVRSTNWIPARTSGNPAGWPKGARGKATILAEGLFEERGAGSQSTRLLILLPRDDSAPIHRTPPPKPRRATTVRHPLGALGSCSSSGSARRW